MPDGLVQYATELYVRIWPALVGAVVALYFHPGDSTRGDRIFAGAASVGLSVLFGPGVVEYFAVESAGIAVAIHGSIALFGLTAAREVFTSIRSLGLPEMLRERLRRFIG